MSLDDELYVRSCTLNRKKNILFFSKWSSSGDSDFKRHESLRMNLAIWLETSSLKHLRDGNDIRGMGNAHTIRDKSDRTGRRAEQINAEKRNKTDIMWH